MTLAPGLEDHGGLDADDPVVAREVIIGEVLEVLHIANGDVGEQIETARKQKDLANFRDLIETLDEGIDGVSLVAGQLDVDQRLHAESEFGEIDIGMSAAEEPGVAKLLKAFVTGRRG